MSQSTRKVGFYSIYFQNNGATVAFNESQFENFLNNLMSIANIDRKISIDDNKFYFLDNCNISTENGIKFFKCVFKSAKIHHRPTLINESDLIERDNPKEYTEGECEKTHVIFKVSNNNIIAVAEERRLGVSFYRMFNYLQIMLDRLALEYDGTMNYKIIMQDNFMDELNNLLKVNKITLYKNIEYNGTEFFDFTANDIENLDKETIEFRAKRRRSIKSVAQRIFNNNIIGINQTIRNIKIDGYDENGRRAIDFSNFKKTASFDTEINSETGVVNSEHIFSRLQEQIINM
nr:hypothetical protein [uncultured Campylobacter sp.]